MRFWPGRLLHARNFFTSTLILPGEVVAKTQVQHRYLGHPRKEPDCEAERTLVARVQFEILGRCLSRGLRMTVGGDDVVRHLASSGARSGLFYAVGKW